MTKSAEESIEIVLSRASSRESTVQVRREQIPSVVCYDDDKLIYNLL